MDKTDRNSAEDFCHPPGAVWTAVLPMTVALIFVTDNTELTARTFLCNASLCKKVSVSVIGKLNLQPRQSQTIAQRLSMTSSQVLQRFSDYQSWMFLSRLRKRNMLKKQGCLLLWESLYLKLLS